MKKLLVFGVLITFISACNTPVKKGSNEFTINGRMDTVFIGAVYLQQRLDGPFNTIDSAVLTDGKFFFKGTIDYPEMYYLNIKGSKSLIPFFLEPSRINIAVNTSEINKSKISGSASQAEYDKYLDQLDQYNFRIREDYTMRKKAEELGDREKMLHFDSLLSVVDDERSHFIKDFIKNNNNSPITPYLLYRNLYDYDLHELDEAMSNFDTTLQVSPYMPFLADYLRVLKRTDIGQHYVPFTMQDTSGTYIPLADLIGKNYLLVDFWASWCRPCREENPNVLSVYKDFKNKGFDILGVSLDRNKKSWEKAIQDDKLTWHHVSDLGYWQSVAARLYGIRSIPSNVLIDPNGVIIAKNLRGNELRNKLNEIFNKTGA